MRTSEMELRLVEIQGYHRFTSERVTGTCARETLCEEGKPGHRVAGAMCTFVEEETNASLLTWFAPGKGVGFVATATCIAAQLHARRVVRARHEGASTLIERLEALHVAHHVV